MSIKIFNIDFKGLSKKNLLTDRRLFTFVVTAHSDMISQLNEDKLFMKAVKDAYITFDGQIPYLLARIKFPTKRIEKISGSSFIYDICEEASRLDKKIFLLGGISECNNKSVDILNARYGVNIKGYSPPFNNYPFPNSVQSDILKKLIEFSPDYLLVAFGAKKQEMWIDDNRDFLMNIGVKFAMGVGGTFEMVANKYKRAPYLLQILGFETIFRFIQDPSAVRLKRTFNSFKIFKYLFFKSKDRVG